MTAFLALVALVAPSVHMAASAERAGSPETQPADVPATRPAGFEDALILPILGQITDITLKSMERRLVRLEETDARLVIIELDTPGGALKTTLEICKLIKRLRDDGVTVYAWVNDEAYSAGTIIALATDGIVMARNSTIGDCQPIMLTGSGAAAVPKELEAKVTSPLLEELEDSVRRNGYNFDMVLSFIRPEMMMFWLVDTETGERRFVDRAERDRLFELNPAERDDRDDAGDTNRRGRARDARTEPVPDTESRTAWRYVTEAPELGEVFQPVVDSDRQLLTMRTPKAIAFGFAEAELNTKDDLRRHFNVTGSIERIENTAIETAIEWLASPMVRSLLFLLILLGAYAEFQSPGFGVPGAVAIVALVIFLGAPYLAGITVTWDIILIMVGVILIAVELFVLPGFGVAGILGMALVVIGLIASFVPPEPWFPGKRWFLPSLQGTYRYIEHGVYSLAAGMTGSLIGMALLAKYFPRMPVGNRIIIANPTPEQVHMEDPYDGLAQVGDMGRTESLLRPAGKARFGARLIDVVSEGEYIQKDTRVEVIARHGNRVVVRRAE